MKRGEIWTVSGGSDYTGKPRPAVIIQDDIFDATPSVTICAFTSDPSEAQLLRLRIEPSDLNGLTVPSRLMVDKVTTVSRSKIGSRIGRLAPDDIAKLNRAIIVLLGLTSK